MGSGFTLNTKEIAFICVFASIYALLSLWSLFPVIGAPGKFIALSAVISPLMGLILGSKIGLASTSLGGFLISLAGNSGVFGPLSFIPGASAAFSSGLIREGRRLEFTLLYSIALTLFMFYPNSGPLWTFPLFLWLQILCLIFILSPFFSRINGFLNDCRGRKLIVGVAAASFASTLFSHIIGCLMFEMMFNGYFNSNGWILLWQTLTMVYPVERISIVFVSTLIGPPLIKILKTWSLISPDTK